MNKWKKNNSDHKNYLLCKGVKFYTSKDEDAFFEWLYKIDCIESLDAAKDELYLDLVDRDLSSEDIYDLIGIFRRYEIDMRQLAKYKTDANLQAYDVWHKEIFG